PAQFPGARGARAGEFLARLMARLHGLLEPLDALARRRFAVGTVGVRAGLAGLADRIRQLAAFNAHLSPHCGSCMVRVALAWTRSAAASSSLRPSSATCSPRQASRRFASASSRACARTQ